METDANAGALATSRVAKLVNGGQCKPSQSMLAKELGSSSANNVKNSVANTFLFHFLSIYLTLCGLAMLESPKEIAKLSID